MHLLDISIIYIVGYSLYELRHAVNHGSSPGSTTIPTNPALPCRRALDVRIEVTATRDPRPRRRAQRADRLPPRPPPHPRRIPPWPAVPPRRVRRPSRAAAGRPEHRRADRPRVPDL